MAISIRQHAQSELMRVQPLVTLTIGDQIPARFGLIEDLDCLVLESQLPKCQPEWELSNICAQYLSALGAGDCKVCSLIKPCSSMQASNLLVVTASADFKLSPDEVRDSLALLMSRLVAQRDMLTTAVPEGPPHEWTEAATKGADAYLGAYGGKPITNQVFVCAGGTQVASLKGKWQETSAEDKSAKTERYKVRYDGRRLSTRQAFFLRSNGGLVAFYDEQKFGLLPVPWTPT